jgi:hypothetical protein
MASVSQLHEECGEIRSSLKDMEVEYAGEAFDDDAKTRWNTYNEQLEEKEGLIKELEARRSRVEELDGIAANVEREPTRASFNTRKASVVPDDPTALEEYRTRASSLDDLEQGYRDGALKIIDERYRHSVPGINREEAQADAERLVGLDQEVALRFITTTSKRYAKEFETYVRTQGMVVGQEMQRTASLTTTAGGFAVPV